MLALAPRPEDAHMRFRRWQVEIAATLIVLAVLVYGLRWELFSGQTMHKEMLRYLIDDVAFLFIQVLLVSLLLDGLMQRRAREAMLNKLNMIIGAFFSECGTELLGQFAEADTQLGEVRADLVATAAWTPQDYELAKRAFRGHETFSDLLWAVTHVAEELDARSDLSQLPAAATNHIADDVKRAYTLLGVLWIDHLRHLQTQYPFLFSLAMRTNPLDPKASATVTS